MPRLSLNVPHSRTPDEVVRRLREKIASIQAEYEDHVSDFRQEWRDHTFSFGFSVLGMKVSGEVAVEPQNVRLSADLPMAAAMFKGMIEDRVRLEVGAILS
jgi:hypothetical protein